MRYYCVKHHINQGDYPRKHLVDEIKNFDEPTFIEEIGQEALAYNRLRCRADARGGHGVRPYRAGAQELLVRHDDVRRERKYPVKYWQM